jgi:hypothetical protein
MQTMQPQYDYAGTASYDFGQRKSDDAEQNDDMRLMNQE